MSLSNKTCIYNSNKPVKAKENTTAFLDEIWYTGLDFCPLLLLLSVAGTESGITWHLGTCTLTVIEVLQQVLLAREVQFDFDGEGQSYCLTRL